MISTFTFLETMSHLILKSYQSFCLCSAPDVSVVSSSVSGHEGGDISVQCFYSSGYQNKVKQWCRYKDQSCYTVGRTDTSQNSSVQISDDGRRSFTVLMTGLRLTDSGWYFCSVRDLQVHVHLTVTEPKRGKITNQFSHGEIINAYKMLLKLTYFCLFSSIYNYSSSCTI